MARASWAMVGIALGVSGCMNPFVSRPPPDPPVWSANYAVPLDAMVNCLVSSPAGAFTVAGPTYGMGGVATITLTPTTAPQANSRYVVYRLPDNGSQVNWWRPGNIGNIDWLDAEARTRANRCGNV